METNPFETEAVFVRPESPTLEAPDDDSFELIDVHHLEIPSSDSTKNAPNGAEGDPEGNKGVDHFGCYSLSVIMVDLDDVLMKLSRVLLVVVMAFFTILLSIHWGARSMGDPALSSAYHARVFEMEKSSMSPILVERFGRPIGIPPSEKANLSRHCRKPKPRLALAAFNDTNFLKHTVRKSFLMMDFLLQSTQGPDLCFSRAPDIEWDSVLGGGGHLLPDASPGLSKPDSHPTQNSPQKLLLYDNTNQLVDELFRMYYAREMSAIESKEKAVVLSPSKPAVSSKKKSVRKARIMRDIGAKLRKKKTLQSNQSKQMNQIASNSFHDALVSNAMDQSRNSTGHHSIEVFKMHDMGTNNQRPTKPKRKMRSKMPQNVGQGSIGVSRGVRSSMTSRPRAGSVFSFGQTNSTKASEMGGPLSSQEFLSSHSRTNTSVEDRSEGRRSGLRMSNPASRNATTISLWTWYFSKGLNESSFCQKLAKKKEAHGAKRMKGLFHLHGMTAVNSPFNDFEYVSVALASFPCNQSHEKWALPAGITSTAGHQLASQGRNSSRAQAKSVSDAKTEGHTNHLKGRVDKRVCGNQPNIRKLMTEKLPICSW